MVQVNWNAGDKDVSDGYPLLPDGEYDLKIVSVSMGKSKNDDPQAIVDYVVVNGLEYQGRSLKFHRLTFIPNDGPGAWIAKSFLKAIGQPYKGKDVILETDAWLGKILHANVGTHEYNGRKFNKVKGVSSYAGPEIKTDGPDCPF